MSDRHVSERNKSDLYLSDRHVSERNKSDLYISDLHVSDRYISECYRSECYRSDGCISDRYSSNLYISECYKSDRCISGNQVGSASFVNIADDTANKLDGGHEVNSQRFFLRSITRLLLWLSQCVVSPVVFFPFLSLPPPAAKCGQPAIALFVSQS